MPYLTARYVCDRDRVLPRQIDRRSLVEFAFAAPDPRQEHLRRSNQVRGVSVGVPVQLTSRQKTGTGDRGRRRGKRTEGFGYKNPTDNCAVFSKISRIVWPHMPARKSQARTLPYFPTLEGRIAFFQLHNFTHLKTKIIISQFTPLEHCVLANADTHAEPRTQPTALFACLFPPPHSSYSPSFYLSFHLTRLVPQSRLGEQLA